MAGGKLLASGTLRHTAIEMLTSEPAWWLKQLRTELALSDIESQLTAFLQVFLSPLYQFTFSCRSNSTLCRNPPSERSRPDECRFIVPEVSYWCGIKQAALLWLQLWHWEHGYVQVPDIPSPLKVTVPTASLKQGVHVGVSQSIQSE